MALIVAMAIGFAFGFVLERAGLGSARKLAGQFYFTDFTVMKVMMTAIAVAMTGSFWLARIGAIDLANVYVPETSLAAQLAGGAIFGVGFLIAGLCPGTSCVAAATGRGDGVAVMSGMFAGTLLAGLVVIPSDFRRWTLPELLHVPYGVIVGAVVIAFAFIARRWAPVIAAAALVTAFAATPYTVRDLDAITLASWIKSHRPGVEIIDRRAPVAFASMHIPLSVNQPGDGSIVVRESGREYVLRGGIAAWNSEVLRTQHPTPTTIYFAPLRRHGC
ncbi:MAG TPA: YeeE/YedE thiosulfate transporter family protein [Thermoanaerobaculia bacterium]|nr:YeeE/YedE thiosulfate transporter family protein [Thermoanaerobaculia bacterium]